MSADTFPGYVITRKIYAITFAEKFPPRPGGRGETRIEYVTAMKKSLFIRASQRARHRACQYERERYG